MPQSNQNLVPGRECGGCTLCCRLPAVDTPELQKQAGVLCDQCTVSQGCAIHAQRPQVCRDWFCGWRRLPRLDEGWRPDRWGVMIALGADQVPPGYAPYESTKFIVADDGPWLAGPAFLSYLAGLVSAGAAAYLAVPGPPGHHNLKALLNPHVRDAAARRDGDAMARIVRDLQTSLAKGPFERVALRHGPLSGRTGVGRVDPG
jgi:hypothetical protein